MFAGLGGICLGFQQAGFDITWANEFDKYACETYRLNHPNVRLIEGNVCSITPEELGYVDIITAGFPCNFYGT